MIAKLSKDLKDTTSHISYERDKYSQFPIERIARSYNETVSKLFYYVFDSSEIEDVRKHAIKIIKTGSKKLQSYGIKTMVFTPGSEWNDSDYSEEPDFVETSDLKLHNTIRNCRLFGISFNDDAFPSTLANIEVYRAIIPDGY